MKTKSLLTLTFVASLLMVPLTSYAESTWNLPSDCVSCNTDSATSGNQMQFEGTVTMTGAAWSTAPYTAATATFAAATLKNWGTINGFGVLGLSGSTDDSHTLDNRYGTDLIALSFDQAVALTSVQLGWIQNDADISVLRYKNTGSNVPTSIGDAIFGVQLNSLAGLVTSGWELVGHYANLQETSKTAVIDGAESSSWWLISAYNSNYGVGTEDHGGVLVGNSKLTSGTNKYGADYVKLLSVAGNVASPPPPAETPEPAGIALVGLGLLGIMFSRRQRRPS